MSGGTRSKQLTQANLDQFAPANARLVYDRKALRHGIVHIGVGGFFRAHQAVYLDDLLGQGGSTEWGICGVCLRPSGRRMYDAMRSQDCLYTVVERTAQGDQPRIIGAMTGILFAPDDPEAVLEKMASPDCRIVTLTITEGAYYRHPGDGQFDAGHPDIVRDLADPTHPACVFGYLAEALDRRRRRGLEPFTVMTCDNMQHNGTVLRRLLLTFTQLRDPALSAWLAERGAFPNSMVDRIVPVTTDEHRTLVRERLGIDDAWPVVCEPFSQWVIEDRFCLGRPAWERTGAQLTDDVNPYEQMKLRLLNASHMCVCYLAMLLGYEFTHQPMADPRIRRIVRTSMDVEVTPLLPEVRGIDLEKYKDQVLERFSNPTIRDQLSRVGSGCSAKMTTFVVPSMLDLVQRGGPLKAGAFTVAAWFRFLAGKDDQGRELPILDDLKDMLNARALRGGADPTELLACRELFGDILPASPRFVAEVARVLRSFYDKGAEATLEQEWAQ